MKPLVEHLYVHTPFCASVCPYCAFSVEVAGTRVQERFVSALETEMRLTREQYDWSLKTIYFGGGTPSLLAPGLFQRMTQSLPAVLEFTLEVNPATVTEAKMQAWIEAGVNRISLGAQSFDADYLKLLGRQHKPEDIPETCQDLRRAGFQNINLDLMYALPHQPLELWQRTVEAALACSPQHLSCYGLTYEEDTPFFQRLQSGEWQIDEARELTMFQWTRERLRSVGLPPYEVSNFARTGYESLHNQAGWQGRDYLGLGPSASSIVQEKRWKNFSTTEAYASALEEGRLPRTDIEPNSPRLRLRERRLFGLRTREGLPRELVHPLTPDQERLISEGLIHWSGDALVLTERGFAVADSIAEFFLDDAALPQPDKSPA